jgi:hypothetical protein
MDVENKIKGLGQELGVFQMRYFKEVQELQAKVATLETLMANLQTRMAAEEKKPREVVKMVEPETKTNSWWDKILK